MIPPLPFRLRKTPIDARFFSAVLALVLLVSPAQAQGGDGGPSPTPLTEREAVRRAVERAALRAVTEGETRAAEGRQRTAAAYPNPQLSYLREQTFGALGTGEDYLSIAQTFDLGNRRGLAGDAGEKRARASREDGSALRVAVVADARLRFFELRHRQLRVEALDEWLVRIDRALAVVARRERAGDAAKYDRRRLERERAVAEVRAEAERAACEGARGRLHALIGEDSGAVVASGALLPEAAPSALPTLRASIDARPDVRALDWRAAAAALDRKAASRWWAPDVRLEAGWKGVDLGRGNRTDGFLVGVTLSVPAWDRSAGVARAAEGEARAAQGRRALLVAEARDGLGGARAEALRLRAAAETMRSKAGAASADLVRIATAGYEGGELGLLELLDAYRGAADDSVAALDLELAARRARIELDRVTGSETP